MTTVSVNEAKTNLSKLLQAVERGEEVYISRRGKTVAKLVFAEEEAAPKGQRILGSWAGRIWESPDCWDPMTEEELSDWYDGPILPEES